MCGLFEMGLVGLSYKGILHVCFYFQLKNKFSRVLNFFSKEMTNERGHFISNWAMIEDELLGPLFSSVWAI